METVKNVSIGPADHWQDYFWKRLHSFTKLDSIRLNEILEISQYSFIYFLAAFVVGGAMNLIFPEFSEYTPTGQLAFEVMGELMVITIAIFYLRKFAKIVPFLFQVRIPGTKEYIPYKTTEYQGEIALSIIFVGLQFRLIKKIDLLASRLYELILGIKKRQGIAR